MVRCLQFQWADPLSLKAPQSLDLAKKGTQTRPTNSTSRKRAEFIDITRGLLLLLMATAHALFLAEVPAFFSSKVFFWLLGGMPKSFVILSGFSIGYIYSLSIRNLPQWDHRLIQRAREVFLVMFVSNVFFLGTKHLMQGNVAVLGTLDWWVGLFTFQTPYSLSGVLVPAAMLCLVAPLILHVHIKQYTQYILPTMIGISFLIEWTQKSVLEIPDVPLILDILLINGAGGYKILPIFGSGLIGLALGIIWHRHRSIPINPEPKIGKV